MTRTRVVCYLLCFALLFGVLGGLAGNRVVTAAQESSNGSFLLPLNQEQPLGEKLELIPTYPTLSDIAGKEFAFTVGLKYQGSEVRIFDLGITVPAGWMAIITPEFESKEIRAIALEPGKIFPDKVMITLAPSPWELPEPGEYVVVFEAVSGNIRESVELKAVVTAQYRFAFYTSSGRLDTKAKAGEENLITVEVMNTGTVPLEDVEFLSGKPGGWTVTFNPKKIESVALGFQQTVEVIIKPPRETIAGDYEVDLTAMSKLVRSEIQLRVTVLTPTIWGWVGILIVLAVIAGLGVIFRRLGRR